MLTSNYNWEDKTILIAEDIDSNYLFLEAALRYTRAKVIWAKNGLIAVEKCHELQPDLILMDIQMPVMNGMDATREIKTNHPGIPIIAQTAFAMENEKEKIFEAGFCDYLAKPIRLDTLFKTIDKYFK